MLLSSVREEPGPQDKFKANRVFVTTQKEIPDKPNNYNPFNSESLLNVPQINPGHQQKIKWSQ